MNSLINEWIGRQIHVKLIGLLSPHNKSQTPERRFIWRAA
jgi:hypothetical protein